MLVMAALMVAAMVVGTAAPAQAQTPPTPPFVVTCTGVGCAGPGGLSIVSRPLVFVALLPNVRI